MESGWMIMNWKDYEVEIFEQFKSAFKDADITTNVTLNGRYSKTKRQIDILVEQYVAGNRIQIIIDCKYFNRKVDVKCVESFISMLEDVGAHKGLLITSKGYSEAALNRAYYGSSNVELDILNFDQLSQFQSFSAIPYVGQHGVLLSAPFGWVIDISHRPGSLATLCRQGLEVEEAINNYEFMYVHFWGKSKDNDSLEDLLEIQKATFDRYGCKYEIEYIKSIKRDNQKTKLRKVKVANKPFIECAGFVEFEEFIFFCILITPENKSKANIRKLENIMQSIIPIKVTHESEEEG